MTTNSTDADLPTNEIFVDTNFNCRGIDITPGSVLELAESIQANGLLQRVIVQEYNDPDNPKYKYRVLAGHRRLTAIKQLKWPTTPCHLMFDVSDEQAEIINLIENLERKDLNLLQEAKAVDKIAARGNTANGIAKKLGVSRNWVVDRLMLMELPDDVQLQAASGLIKASHIKMIHEHKDIPEDMYDTVRKIKDKEHTRNNIIVRLESENTKAMKEKLSTRKFRNMSDVFLVQDLCLEAFDTTNLVSRTLAWVIGEISLHELLIDVKHECDVIGVAWEIPEEYKDKPNVETNIPVSVG